MSSCAYDFEMSGRGAYRAGKPKSPARDKPAMAAMKDLQPMQKVNALRAWLVGWSAERAKDLH